MGSTLAAVINCSVAHLTASVIRRLSYQLTRTIMSHMRLRMRPRLVIYEMLAELVTQWLWVRKYLISGVPREFIGNGWLSGRVITL